MEKNTYTFDYDAFSDFHKDTFGFRPRNHSFYAPETTDDKRQEMWDDLMVSHTSAMEQYDEQQQYNMTFFENLVDNTIDCGAKCRKTAIRWLIQGLDLTEWDLMYGGGYVVYRFDLPSSYEQEFNKIIEGMKTV